MQEIFYALYQPFVNEYYNEDNKCTHPDIAKATLKDRNQGIFVTMKNGNRYKVTCERILE